MFQYLKADDKGAFVRALLQGFFRVTNYALWDKVFGYDKIKLEIPHKPENKTMEWLFKTVAPTLGRIIAIKGENVLDRFLLHVEAERRKFEGEMKKGK